MKRIFFICFFISMFFNGKAQNDTVQSAEKLIDISQEFEGLLTKINQQSETKKDAEIEFDGLVIDDTKTKNGRDFYEYFHRDWIAPMNARNYTVFIIELPFRLNTTMIEIKINETSVFQSYLQPRSEFLETLAEEAVNRTQMYLKDYEEIVKQLDGEDRSGSGIY